MSYPHIRMKPKSVWNPLTVICFTILIGALAFYLFTEHAAHTLGALPFLIFLACPLMHLFMHRGHGHSVSQAEQEIDTHAGHDQQHPGGTK